VKPEREPPGDGAPEPLRFPIEDAIDLHAFHPRDLDAAVTEYLWEAARAGLREVRIIHGKGIGVQRRRVAALLARHPAVVAFGPAPAERGHWGATIVRLRLSERT
jgi:DNA-nicking Smr family endonuclease